MDRLSGRRRGFFVSYLVVAAALSGLGIVVLLRSVARERELAERKGNLVAAVSHEMRTPVASIRLPAENLSTGAADSEERRTGHLQRLLEQSERLSTLVESALKHSPKGGEVSFGAGPDAERSDGWCLWVSDAGPGVPKAEREKVFEAFYRVGPELRRETKGTGLGLALVRQVADAHGGEVVCREVPGFGARFELPLSNKVANPDKLRT